MNERAALDALTDRLWDERRIVTFLLYRLTVTKLLLAADDRRFVPDALEEVDRTVELLREGEARREAALRKLAGAWGVSPEQLTLDVLARRAPAPYDTIFREHLEAFGALAAEIEDVARDNRELARSELEHLGVTLDVLTGIDRSTATTYNATGQVDPDTPVGGNLRKVL